MKHIKENFISIFLISLFAFISEAGAVEINAYDLCYEEPTYEGSKCVDMVDGFKGGVDCKEKIPIRNLSKYKLVNTKVVLDNDGVDFTNGFDCGINGASKNGSSCKNNSSYNLTSNLTFSESVDYSLGDYSASATKNIYTKTDAKLSSPMFTGDNLYASYKKNNISYEGQIASCQIKVGLELDIYEISEAIDGPVHEKYVHPTLVLNRPVDHVVKVTYYTTDGTAKVSNGDYPKVISRTVTIPKGDTTLALDVAIYNDAPIELRESFWITLKNPYPSDVVLDKIDKAQIVISAQEEVVSCFDDDFSNGLDKEWRVLKASGGFTPDIFNVNGDYRLRITKDAHDLSTAITKDVVFPSAENLIIIEFDYYAYGGCSDNNYGHNQLYFGADGIANILFDSTVGDKPSPGGFGGSLGYAQIKTPDGTHDGFEGGWLGLGLDEYGNYGNCNEGRVGGFSPKSGKKCLEPTPGQPYNTDLYIPPYTKIYQHSNTAVIRGNGDGMSGYNFLKGVKVSPSYPGDGNFQSDYGGGAQPFIAELLPYYQTNRYWKKVMYGSEYKMFYPNKDNSSNGYYSGRYKMKVDSRDPSHLYISLLRSSAGHPENSEDEKTTEYHTLIEEFDAKSSKYNQGPTPDKVRYAISGSTGIGCNIHELSWIRVKGRCAKFVPETEPAKGIFGTKDVWRNFDDEKISTKLIDKEFKLDIMSLKPDYSGTMTRDGMVVKWALKYMNKDGQALVYGADSNNKGGYQGDWNVSKVGILDNKPFIVKEAQKDMWLEIKYCSDYNSTRAYIVGHPYDECLGREEITEETIAEWIGRGAPTSGVDYNNVGLHLTLHKGDHFSVRPTHFVVDKGSNSNFIKSGNEHNITLTAYSGNKARSKNYNAGLSTIKVDSSGKQRNGILDKALGELNIMGTSLAMIAEGISSLNADGSGKHDVLGVTFNNVGDVEFAMIDKTWANVDNLYGDDTPKRCMTISEINKIQAYNSRNTGVKEPFSSWICTEKNTTITFIPDHFEIADGSIQNHNNGDFTYISNDLNMSSNINLTIMAKNKAGDTTSNFTDDINLYENPVSVVLNIKKIHPEGDNIIKVDIPKERKLGFKGGSYKIKSADKILAFNYERFNNKPINPFDVNGTEGSTSEADISVDIKSTYSSSVVIEGEGNITKGSATFFYAKTKPSKFFYQDIEEKEVNTPVSIYIYCDPSIDKKGCTYQDIIDDTLGRSDEFNWYKALKHDYSNSDGDIVIKKHILSSALGVKSYGLMEGSGKPIIDPKDIDIDNDGIQENVVIKRGNNAKPPMTVAIELETDNSLNKTDSWLLYNEASATEKPDPFFKVRFIDNYSWAGVGKEGTVIDRESSGSSSKRLNW